MLGGLIRVSSYSSLVFSISELIKSMFDVSSFMQTLNANNDLQIREIFASMCQDLCGKFTSSWLIKKSNKASNEQGRSEEIYCRFTDLSCLNRNHWETLNMDSNCLLKKSCTNAIQIPFTFLLVMNMPSVNYWRFEQWILTRFHLEKCIKLVKYLPK